VNLASKTASSCRLCDGNQTSAMYFNLKQNCCWLWKRATVSQRHSIKLRLLFYWINWSSINAVNHFSKNLQNEIIQNLKRRNKTIRTWKASKRRQHQQQHKYVHEIRIRPHISTNTPSNSLKRKSFLCCYKQCKHIQQQQQNLTVSIFMWGKCTRLWISTVIYQLNKRCTEVQ